MVSTSHRGWWEYMSRILLPYALQGLCNLVSNTTANRLLFFQQIASLAALNVSLEAELALANFTTTKVSLVVPLFVVSSTNIENLGTYFQECWKMPSNSSWHTYWLNFLKEEQTISSCIWNQIANSPQCGALFIWLDIQGSPLKSLEIFSSIFSLNLFALPKWRQPCGHSHCGDVAPPRSTRGNCARESANSSWPNCLVILSSYDGSCLKKSGCFPGVFRNQIANYLLDAGQ